MGAGGRGRSLDFPAHSVTASPGPRAHLPGLRSQLGVNLSDVLNLSVPQCPPR